MGLEGLTGLGGIRLWGRGLVFVIPPLLFSSWNFGLAWLAGDQMTFFSISSLQSKGKIQMRKQKWRHYKDETPGMGQGGTITAID